MATLVFKQFMFKLMVMDELIYGKERVPAFDCAALEKQLGRPLFEKGNWKMPEDDFYGFMPEVKEWFEAYPIDSEMVADIESLRWEAGSQVMQDVAPNWDGEDELFDLTPEMAEDAALLPKLKKVAGSFEPAKRAAIVEAFAAHGVEVAHVYG